MAFRNFQDLSAGCANTTPAPERLEQHLRSVISRLTTPERSIAFNYYCAKAFAQEFLLLLGQVGRDDLEVVLLELVNDLVGRRGPAGQGEQGGGALRHLLANLLYEVVVDPDVGQEAADRAHPRPHPRPKEGDKEEHPEQKTPEGTPACAHGAVRLTGLGSLVALGPADQRRVHQGDHPPLTQAPKGYENPACPVWVVELQYR